MYCEHLSPLFCFAVLMWLLENLHRTWDPSNSSGRSVEGLASASRWDRRGEAQGCAETDNAHENCRQAGMS